MPIDDWYIDSFFILTRLSDFIFNNAVCIYLLIQLKFIHKFYINWT